MLPLLLSLLALVSLDDDAEDDEAASFPPDDDLRAGAAPCCCICCWSLDLLAVLVSAPVLPDSAVDEASAALPVPEPDAVVVSSFEEVLRLFLALPVLAVVVLAIAVPVVLEMAAAAVAASTAVPARLTAVGD